MNATDDRTTATHRFADVPFVLAAFAGSALLFVVQPMAAKQLLPTLGGAPAVWTTSVLFFQLALLAGYAWAHLGPRWLGDRWHAIAHVALLVVACVTLPIGLRSGWQPDDARGPIANVMVALARSLGLPLAALCATSPLIQRWHVALRPTRGDRVYRLYAIGNVASLLVLLAYPLAIEPTMTVRAQLVAWSIAFVALALLLGGIAFRRISVAQAFLPVSGGTPPEDFDCAKASSNTGRNACATEGGLAASQRTRVKEIVAWVVLSAVPSSLLLGVTTFLTSDVAAVPFLWVLPLAIYLGVFSLAFAGLAMPTAVARVLAPGLAATCLLLAGLGWNALPLAAVLAIQLGTFFVCAWAALATLYRARPTGERLTSFYLWIAVGGCVGGAFNSLAAPLLFDTVAEYPLGLLAAAAIAAAWPVRGDDRRRRLGPAMAVALVSACAVYALSETRAPLDFAPSLLVAALIGPAVLCLALRFAPTGASLPVGLAAAAIIYMSFGASARSVAHRSFFGVHRVGTAYYGEPPEPMLELRHGTTTHGLQHLDLRTNRAVDPEFPLAYYHRGGPLGEAMRAVGRPARVGVVGLGGGAIAAYVGAGQSLTFFEIDPIVIRLADGHGPFTYVPAARERGASVEIVEGDARLTLARSGQTFDFLALDAFSGDAIPAHLLTREAFAMYADHLAPNGTLAVHISNRHLDLSRVVAAGATAIGGAGRVGDESTWLVAEAPPAGAAGSTWVVISRDPTAIAQLSDAHWRPLPAFGPSDAWTDDFSNLINAIR